MAEIRTAFGRAVRIARVRRGWSQDQLAKAAGLNRTYISGVESGDRNPVLETQERIATALGLTLAELVTAAEEERVRQRHRLAQRRGAPPSETGRNGDH